MFRIVEQRLSTGIGMKAMVATTLHHKSTGCGNNTKKFKNVVVWIS